MNTRTTQVPRAQIHTTTRRKAGGNPVSMSKTWAMAFRQRYVILGCIIGALLIGALITLLTEPRYTAQASVQLEQQSATVIPEGGLEPEIPVQESERFLQTQLDRILSRNTAERVADRLKISSSPSLLAALDFDDGGANATIEDITLRLQENVTAALGLNTRLAQITFTSLDRQASAQIANAFADQMVSNDFLNKSDTSARAEQYLAAELADAKVKLQDSEKAMLAYARSADLTASVVPASSGDQSGSLRAQQLAQLSGALANATAARIEAEQNWRQVQGVSAMALPDVQGNKAIQDMISDRATLNAEIADQRERYTSEYPGVAVGTAKVREIDKQITRLSEDIKSAQRGRYTAAAQTERQLRGSIDQLRGSAMAERERGVNYNALQREVETNRAFYDGLLERYQAVAAASGAPGQNIQVVDRAEPPLEPSSPNPVSNLALSGILGLIAALGFALLRERSSTLVRSSSDAETYLGVTSLGAIPAFGKRDNQDSAILDPRSAQSEAYYSAAVALYRMTGNDAHKRVLVTSSTPGEGKSTSSIGLTRSLAAMGKRVLLVDGDLRRPSLGMMLGQPLGAGLGEILAGQTGPYDSVHTLASYGFDLLTSGNSDSDPVTLLSASNLARVLAELSDRYDIVVIDGPPIMGIADSVLLAEHVDAGIFVIEANSKDVEELEVAIARLPEDLPIGSIVTKFDARVAGVKYGRQSYYRY